MNALTEIIAAANKDRDIAKARIEALEAALETAAGRFNMMAGVGLVNGVDPKVGYRECRAALAPVLCPTSDPSWPESQPCSVCGAFGPWFDTPQIGECVEAIRAALASERDK